MSVKQTITIKRTVIKPKTKTYTDKNGNTRCSSCGALIKK